MAAGILLFAIGFVFWFLGMQGAGDAKLALPIGLFVGVGGLPVYAGLLILVSLLLLVLLRSRIGQGGRSAVAVRLDELRRDQRIPYSLPMIGAALPVLILRHI